MYLRFGNNPSNTWEIMTSGDGKKVTAIYRGRIPSAPTEPIENVDHDERQYRLWKMFNIGDSVSDHMPDALPMIYHMGTYGFEKVQKIRDTKYLFTKIQQQ